MNGPSTGILPAAMARKQPGELAYREPTVMEREIARGELPELSDFAVPGQGPYFSIHTGEER